MENKIKIIKFGEDVEGYKIPVLNEREVRAAAGVLFILMFISVFTVLLKGNFVLLKYAIIIFLTDMLLRVYINPKFSPSLILGRLIVRDQAPEYVGALQKKFAWKIGVAIATIMFILQIVLNSYSPITGSLCFICLIFLFFETAFGICIGCKVYSWFKKEKVLYCPGEVCDVAKRADIQKTSITQILIVIGSIVFIFITILLFNDDFSKKPYNMFGIFSSTQSK